MAAKKVKQIVINIASPTAPIVLARDFSPEDAGAYAVINGPSRVVWDPLRQDSPRVWIEIDEDIEVKIKKITKE